MGKGFDAGVFGRVTRAAVSGPREAGLVENAPLRMEGVYRDAPKRSGFERRPDSAREGGGFRIHPV